MTIEQGLLAGSALIGLLLLILLGLTARFASRLARLQAAFEGRRLNDERLERTLREDIAANRREMADYLRQNREELNAQLEQTRRLVDETLNQALGDARLGREELHNSLQRFGEQLGQQLSTLSQRNAESLEILRQTIENKLAAIQADNSAKLEQMRRTVDEKLHNTLEQRLGESFKLVSERLEHVYKGLGEMQNLAAGVGDLKKVLTNVKVRGTWGEVQLEQLLEQLLTNDQYARNVATRPGSREVVEFAIRLPGREEGAGQIWLPIDAKFPLEDYQRLVEAQESGDLAALEQAGKGLEARIRLEAKTLRDKYLEPPHTTDFGLLFLPIEGLYAEVIRRPGLSDQLQREYRVTVTGPTTLTALLNSLQMGFRTLAIEKRSSEVWKVLGAVKSEFGKFGGILEKTRKKLDEARNTIDDAERRTRVMSRKLTQVEELPAAESQALLGQTPEPEWDNE
jgi:DNA recombination protein RmuC